MEPAMLHLPQSNKLPQSKKKWGRSPITPFFLLAVLIPQLGLAQAQVSWNFVGPSGTKGPLSRVLALASDPRNDSVVYLASPGGGVWKTEDGGTTWAAQTDAAPSLQVCSLAIDSTSPDTLYLGMGDDQSPRPDQGVARSIDGGRSWVFGPRFTDQAVCALAVDPSNSARVLAGSAEGLFVSSDSGRSWSLNLPAPVTSIAFDGQGSAYAGTLGDTMLARSSDGGRTWTNLSLPSSGTATTPRNWISIAAAGSSVWLVASYQPAAGVLSPVDFYQSADGGVTWFLTPGLTQARPPMSILALPASNTLYVAAATLSMSTNGGLTWQPVPAASSEFHSVARSAGSVLLGGERGLEAPGRTISQAPIGQFLTVSYDPLNAIWAGGPPGLFGFYTGSTSLETGVPGIRGVLAVASATTASIFAPANSAVYASSNAGASFTSKVVIAAGELRAPYPPLIADPVLGTTAYVAGRRVYRTTNSGGTWTALGTVDPEPSRVVVALAMPPSSRTTIYAVTACLPEVALTSCPSQSWVWRSTNSGDTWIQMSTVAGFIDKLAVDPRQPARVYAAIGAFPGGPSVQASLVTGDLLLSPNNGITWISIRANLPKTSINSILIDAASLPPLINQPAQTIYAATDAGVFVTYNAGLHWTDLSGSAVRSLPPSPVTDIALLPDRTLVAATFGRGIYSMSVTGLGVGVIANPLSSEVTVTQGATITTGVPITNFSTAATNSWKLTPLDSWITVPTSTGALSPLASTQVAVRISAAGLERGMYRGRIQMTAGSYVQNILVDMRVTPAPAYMTIVSGNNGFGGPGTALPPFQVMVTDAGQTPLPGITVTFSVSSGGGSLSFRSVVTNAAGIAGTVYTLPSNPGTTTIVATSGALSVTFTATAVPVPALLGEFVVDGVTFNNFASLGPGSIISISSRNLAETTVIAPSTLLPTVLQGTRVVLTNEAGEETAALMVSISPTQIRAMVPFDLNAGTYRIRVEIGSARSNELQIAVAGFAPGIFTRADNGRGPGIFMKPDGSVVTAANAADRGSTVSFFASGLGAVNPSIAAGQPGSTREPLNRTVATPRVFFDTYAAELVYSGLAPGIAGRYVVTVRVPTFVSPATNVSVSLTIGGFASNRVTIPVR